MQRNEFNFEITENYINIRNKAFSISPDELALSRENGNLLYGIVMDVSSDNNIYTLICFKEGSISLYFNNGGGIIGIGEHTSARNAGIKYLITGTDYIHLGKKTKTYYLPQPGKVHFFLLTFKGIYIIEGKERKIADRKSKYFGLYYSAHEVITQARLIDNNLGRT